MPQYLYQHPKTKKIIEIYQSMNDIHEYFDEKGIKWNRIFTVPNASIDTKIDPWNSKDFADKTGNKKDTLGSLWDKAQEASDKRVQEAGHDPIKEKYYKNYSKKRKGAEHPDIQKKKAMDEFQAIQKKIGVKVEL